MGAALRTKGGRGREDACQALAASVSPLSATLWPVNYGREQWYTAGIVRAADIKRGRSRAAVTSQLENEASARFDGLEFKNGPRRDALIVPLLAQPERHSPR